MHQTFQQQINRALGAVRQAFRSVFGRVNSAGPIQLVSLTGLADENLPDQEQFQEYGFTSSPPAGAMGVVVPLGGKTSHGIIIATEHGSYRLRALATGEVAVYTDEGAKIVLKRGRLIEVDCDTWRVNCQVFEVNASSSSAFNTPTVTASAEVIAKSKITGQGGMAISGGSGAEVDGALHATGDITSGNVSLPNHDHDGDSGGKTGKANPS